MWQIAGMDISGKKVYIFILEISGFIIFSFFNEQKTSHILQPVQAL
jgi:hypothetical protein